MQLAGSDVPVFEIPKELLQILEKKRAARHLSLEFTLSFKDLTEQCRRIA